MRRSDISASDIVLWIMESDEPRDLELIRKAFSLRAKTMAEVRAIVAEQEVYVGDYVKIVNIAVKYLNNKEARVEEIRSDGAFRVYVFDVPVNKSHYHIIPASCIVKPV